MSSLRMRSKLCSDNLVCDGANLVNLALHNITLQESVKVCICVLCIFVVCLRVSCIWVLCMCYVFI